MDPENPDAAQEDEKGKFTSKKKTICDRPHDSGTDSEDWSFDSDGKAKAYEGDERPANDMYNEVITSFGFPQGNFRLIEDNRD